MISVCIATYNGETYLREQIDSILPQLGPDDEVIISDDGSKDATLCVINSFEDKRIRVIQNKGKNGCIHNFENALLHAKGDYIFLSDQDDVWAPNKVQKFVEALSMSDCIISDASVVDTHLNVIEDSFYRCNNNHRGKFYNLFVRNHYLGCCMAFHRRILTKALPFPSHIPMHDIWLGNVAAFYYSLAFIDDKLLSYRRHENNVSSTSEPSTYTLIQKLKIRWNIIKPLLGRMLK